MSVISKTLVGGYGGPGVLDLKLWLCSGILPGSHFEILQISSSKTCCLEQYFCGRHGQYRCEVLQTNIWPPRLLFCYSQERNCLG